jgi:glycerophosphoryl diester phosphodiesterase
MSMKTAVATIAMILCCFGFAFAISNIGHRGTGANGVFNDFPENTIPSFLHALEEGADTIELDVTLTADDAVVVIHDDTLDRTTDCTGAVHDMTLAQVQTCDAAFGTPLQSTGVTVPTLAEVFTALEGSPYACRVNVEIKTSLVGVVGANHLAERVTTETLDAGWAEAVIFSSFSTEVLDEVELIDPSLVTAFLSSNLIIRFQADLADSHGYDGLHPYFFQTLPGTVQYAHNLGLFVNVWTADLGISMKRLRDEGVDGIITNDPDRLDAILAEDDTADDTSDDTTDDTADDSSDDSTDDAQDDTASDDADDSNDDVSTDDDTSVNAADDTVTSPGHGGDDDDGGCCG